MHTEAIPSQDPHAQLRALYVTLLTHQDRFDEFKHLLSLYQIDPERLDHESAEATAVRARLNERLRDWLGVPFEQLSAIQLVQWRQIIVEERMNLALSPWKESNTY